MTEYVICFGITSVYFRDDCITFSEVYSRHQVLRGRGDQLKMNGMVPSCPLWLHQNSSSFESHLISLPPVCSACVGWIGFELYPHQLTICNTFLLDLTKSGQGSQSQIKVQSISTLTSLVRTYLSKWAWFSIYLIRPSLCRDDGSGTIDHNHHPMTAWWPPALGLR